jgi:hypothetical protein
MNYIKGVPGASKCVYGNCSATSVRLTKADLLQSDRLV